MPFTRIKKTKSVAGSGKKTDKFSALPVPLRPTAFLGALPSTQIHM